MSATKHSKRKRSREVLQDLEDELRRTRAELDQLRRAGSGQQQLRDELGLLQRVVHQSTTARQTLALVNVYREEVGAKMQAPTRPFALLPPRSPPSVRDGRAGVHRDDAGNRACV